MAAWLACPAADDEAPADEDARAVFFEGIDLMEAGDSEGAVALRNVTIAHNTSADGGAGIHVAAGGDWP